VRPERPPLLWAGLGVVVLAGLAYFGWQKMERRRGVDAVTALDDRLSLDDDKGAEVRVAERRASPRLFYQVSLGDPPVGGTLDLTCDWTDPAGRVAHHNAWRTQTIERVPWRTHCQWVLPVVAPSGTWRVSMRLGSRELRAATFEVRE
jgi:hypothetical protein